MRRSGSRGTDVNRYAQVLARPAFRWFSLVGALSLAAPSAVLVVLTWEVAVAYPATLARHVDFSALALAFLGISAALPTLAAATVSGTLADRWDRRRLLRATNLAALAATVLLAVDLSARPGQAVALPGPPGFYLPLWLLVAYPLWAVVTAMTTIFRPTYNASLPRLLATADLGTANGIVYALAIGTSVGATIGATALLQTTSSTAALFAPMALFAATQVALTLVRADLNPVERAAPRRFFADAREGYAYLARNRAILEITLTALAINFLSAVAFVELGLYVTSWLASTSAVVLGAMIAGSSVGSGIGTLAVNHLRFERRAGRLLVVLVAGQGLSVLALALVHNVWLALPDMILFGVFPGMYTTVFLSTLQATVPNRLLGRVFAADEVGSYAMVPVGQYAGGLITVATGIQTVYLAAGAGTVAVGGVMAALRDLRRLGFEPKAPSPEGPAGGAGEAGAGPAAPSP